MSCFGFSTSVHMVAIVTSSTNTQQPISCNKYIVVAIVQCEQSFRSRNTRKVLLPPATKLGQGNIFRSVCQEFCSQEGRSAPLHAEIHPPGPDPPSPPGPDPCQEQCTLENTGNKRAVRILLECILVCSIRLLQQTHRGRCVQTLCSILNLRISVQYTTDEHNTTKRWQTQTVMLIRM